MHSLKKISAFNFSFWHLVILTALWWVNSATFGPFELSKTRKRKRSRLCSHCAFRSVFTHLSWQKPEAKKPSAPMCREGGSRRPSPNRWALSGPSMCEKPFHPRLSCSPFCPSVFQLRKRTHPNTQPHTFQHMCLHTLCCKFKQNEHKCRYALSAPSFLHTSMKTHKLPSQRSHHQNWNPVCVCVCFICVALLLQPFAVKLKHIKALWRAAF